MAESGRAQTSVWRASGWQERAAIMIMRREPRVRFPAQGKAVSFVDRRAPALEGLVAAMLASRDFKGIRRKRLRFSCGSGSCLQDPMGGG